ncbi:helix-turn-helix domain-containing protein [Mongoliimonas terrestris]|uniref:helix-turn-helix domain-containing protein n=1 Tax=Mongoliimonas terrestris TaxID=1709001 RepID=UPI0009495BFD|nr:cupin domain-containing protein [Mongoliimonas terrestris]
MTRPALGPGAHDAAAAADQLGRRLGSDIRALRQARDMTLTRLAEETGLSVGLLSQVERGLSEPSVKALHLIATALGTTVGSFFRDADAPASGGLVVRRDARKRIDYGGGIHDELLSPSLDGSLELLLCRLPPGASSGDEPYAHEGEEAGYVLAGTLDLDVDGVIHRLNTGDSFGFPSTRPHRYRNPGSKETVVVWAVTPPSY